MQWLDFINAPDTALVMGGTSTISYSSFGQGGYGIGPSGQFVQETDKQSATRFTAIYAVGSQGGVYYNVISNAGTAAITLAGDRQVVYGNLLARNRHELSDGIQGGQIMLWQGASNATIAGNVINGTIGRRPLTQTFYWIPAVRSDPMTMTSFNINTPMGPR